MKLKITSLLKSLTFLAIASVFLATPAFADTFTGGNFTVTINGFAGSASYTGCDAKERCVHIPSAANYTQGRYIWERKGYTYSMTPEGNTSQYRLKVFDPKQKLLLSQVMKPIAQSKPDYVQELVDNSFCSFIVTNQVNSRVNIRQNPDIKSEVVLQLKRGDGVRAVSRRGDWVKIVALVDGFPPDEKFTPFFGWVNNGYINGCSEDKFDMWQR